MNKSTTGEGPIVKTNSGILLGGWADDKQTTRLFRGIPYAKPPLGHLRWKPAEPLASSEAERLCLNFSPSGLQPYWHQVEGILHRPMVQMSEDCLYLNIWAPDKKAGEGRFPVMVWLHGGGLMEGGSSMPLYDGEELAKKGVIVVSINYRLNIFGYFSHPELTEESPTNASGNYGLSDQIQALKWVQENIAAFSGDPDNVTVFGESAGAYSVMQLLVSPIAQGLFHKAIVQSGYMPPIPDLKQPVFDCSSAEDDGLRFQQALGKNNLSALRAMTGDELLSAYNSLGHKTAPVVDGWLIKEQLFETLEKGTHHKVPVLAGFNSGEGNHYAEHRGVLAADIPNNQTDYIDQVQALYGERSEYYLTLYPPEDLSSATLNPIRDGYYGWGTHKLINDFSRSVKPVYLYYFDHAMAWAREQSLGAFHTSDLPFSFNNVAKNVKYSFNWPDLHPTKADIAMANTISDYWVAFARDGEPKPKGLPQWQPYSQQSRHHMVFKDGDACPSKDLLLDSYQFYEHLFKERRQQSKSWWLSNIGLLAPLPG